jgi:hypothetical protein
MEFEKAEKSETAVRLFKNVKEPNCRFCRFRLFDVIAAFEEALPLLQFLP